jgi:hypothetical protein
MDQGPIPNFIVLTPGTGKSDRGGTVRCHRHFPQTREFSDPGLDRSIEPHTIACDHTMTVPLEPMHGSLRFVNLHSLRQSRV